MASTYTIEDHISHKLVKYHLNRAAIIAFWVIVFTSVFQVLLLWVLIGGGEAYLELRLVDEPLPTVEYWSFILPVIVLGELLTVYVLGWTMTAERSLQYGMNGLIYTSTLWGMTKNKTYALMDIDTFLINATSNKGNDLYNLALTKGAKTLPISPSLSKEDTQTLVELLTDLKAKYI